MAFCGDSTELMKKLPDECIDLIVTSPPFALVFKKEYGNPDQSEYVSWFINSFGRELYRILKPTGSLVIDLGGAYQKGMPVRSLTHFELMIALVKEVGFFLAQEFYWYNPAKMPAPAEWVTVRRIRVRDSVNPVWWLSKTPYPKADNKRVLREYSEDMKRLMEKGYRAKERPSGHVITTKWNRNLGGSIPPNVLEITHVDEQNEILQELLTSNFIRLGNNSANDRYLQGCREAGIKPHPARFPVALPGFFINFLTDPDDIVFDPFGGSSATGAAAEALDRWWFTCEIEPSYVDGAKFRFDLPVADGAMVESKGQLKLNLDAHD
ncbi:MAG: site-specific DNA-methyltransferase [Bacillaceae bacterium]|nr:site-specific DNA-methyltransferase [Bacillaceae bacterium]